MKGVDYLHDFKLVEYTINFITQDWLYFNIILSLFIVLILMIIIAIILYIFKLILKKNLIKNIYLSYILLVIIISFLVVYICLVSLNHSNNLQRTDLTYEGKFKVEQIINKNTVLLSLNGYKQQYNYVKLKNNIQPGDIVTATVKYDKINPITKEGLNVKFGKYLDLNDQHQMILKKDNE